MSPATDSKGLVLPAAVIGIGLGGFFDGILLHQVLQWHHLLSLVPGETFRDLGNQILADGLFHVAMYFVTAAGLWLLWRRRSIPGDGRTIAGGGLLGFGLWNVADVGLFHWLLGIHRIRVDVPDPLAYDLGWLAVFGLIPLLGAWLLLRSPGRPRPGSGRLSALSLALLALLAAPIAALPVPDANAAIAFFPAGARPAAAVDAALRADARILWVDPQGSAMAVQLAEGGGTEHLYRAGAWFVTRSPAIAGCVSAARLPTS